MTKMERMLLKCGRDRFPACPVLQIERDMMDGVIPFLAPLIFGRGACVCSLIHLQSMAVGLYPRLTTLGCDAVQWYYIIAKDVFSGVI